MTGYIMHPNLFETLSTVSGFNDLNGHTYQQHIIKIFGVSISSEMETQILQSTTTNEALNVLKTNHIKYSHDYDQCIDQS